MLRITDVSLDRYQSSEGDPYFIIQDLMPTWEFQETLAVRAYVRRQYNLLHLNTRNEFLADIQSLDQFSRSSVSMAVKNDRHKQQKVPKSEEYPSSVLSQWRQFARIMGGSTHWAESMSRLGMLVLQYTLRSETEVKPTLHGEVVSWVNWRPERCFVCGDACDSHSDRALPRGHQCGQATVLTRRC